jgi:hypothetical protein
MKTSRVEIHDDHLLIKFDGITGVAAMKRALVVPYSTIASAGVEKPQWPGVLDVRAGTHLPGRLAVGTFKGWTSGERRLLDLHRGTTQALKLKLDGHPEYDEVELDVPSAGDVVQAVARHRPGSMRSPPPKE